MLCCSSGLSVRLIWIYTGHRDRSETHPAYLPIFLGEIIKHAYLYIFSIYIFFSFSLCYNEWLASMYVCALFYSRCGKYIEKKKQVDGVFYDGAMMDYTAFFFP